MFSSPIVWLACICVVAVVGFYFWAYLRYRAGLGPINEPMLDTLPHKAAVAFAVRCARRAMLDFDFEPHSDERMDFDLLTQAIDAAESYAKVADPKEYVRWSRAATSEAESAREIAARAKGRYRNAAFAATYAAACAGDPGIDIFVKNALDAYRSWADSTGDELAARKIANSDLKKLLKLNREGALRYEIDPSSSGPLGGLLNAEHS